MGYSSRLRRFGAGRCKSYRKLDTGKTPDLSEYCFIGAVKHTAYFSPETGSSMKAPSIFIADDDGRICTPLGRILRLQQYDVHYVQSVNEALNVLAHSSFDVYLLDYRFQDGTGLELAHYLRGEGSQRTYHSNFRLLHAGSRTGCQSVEYLSRSQKAVHNSNDLHDCASSVGRRLDQAVCHRLSFETDQFLALGSRRSSESSDLVVNVSRRFRFLLRICYLLLALLIYRKNEEYQSRDALYRFGAEFALQNG
jgi:Response regulator receiver domain